MEQKVTVLTPNGRRHNVKITPNTTLLQVLEEACQKHGFDSDNYMLTHHNREVGLTQAFRFSGLPNNCLLEMAEISKKRVAQKVEICIQLEDGTRKSGQFEASDNVWSVIENLGSEAAATYENPVIIYMRQEIYGKTKLSETTLKSLGIIEGRALFRLLDKEAKELKTQANVYIPPTEKPSRSVEKSESERPTKGNSRVVLPQYSMEEDDESNEIEKNELEASEKETKTKDEWEMSIGRRMVKSVADDTQESQQIDDVEAEAKPDMNIIGDRHAIVYSMNTIRKEINELPDSFYDLTVSDLKLVLRDLKRVAQGNEDAPLLTEKLRELEQNKKMLNKIAHYRNCILRVQFPNRYVLQAVFNPSDTIQQVVDFIRKFLVNPDKKFWLFTIPPKILLPLDKNLLELDLIPTAVVHFTWDVEPKTPEEVSNILKPEYLLQLTSIEGAIYAANRLRVYRSRSLTPKEAVEEEDDRPGTSKGALLKRSRKDE